MIRVVALHNPPVELSSYDDYYVNVHMPLVQRVPGVRNIRFGKVLRAGRSRTVVSMDIFNALNIDTVVNANQNFAVWQRPTQILNARVVKFSVQFDY